MIGDGPIGLVDGARENRVEELRSGTKLLWYGRAGS
jgi:hypothetical protein